MSAPAGDYASVLAQVELGDMTVEYVLATESQNVGLRILPTAKAAERVAAREFIDSHEFDRVPEFMKPKRAWLVESLVQAKLVGDELQGFAGGATMRDSETVTRLRYAGQERRESGDEIEIVTTLRSDRGYACDHHLRYRQGDRALTIQTVFRNEGEQPLTLELLASFSLSGITPFADDEAPNRLFLHRFRTWWAAEARPVCEAIEDLGLEPSWLRHGVRCERFGQLGSMPVRDWAPFVAVEDRGAGVFWGAQIEAPGSWQMEVYRRDDELTFSGGLPDHELGHWTKDVAPGESFTSPRAYVTTVAGDVDDVCDRLTAMQLPAALQAPASEHSLPVLFNEYCTTWGNPTHERMSELASFLEGTGIAYFVIDSGWYQFEGADWAIAQGEWNVSPKLFPNGMRETADAIRSHGLVPGIWFEFEVVGGESPLFESAKDHFLYRDGLPVAAFRRRFWDFRDPWARDYLRDRVFGLLRDAGFGYIKVDYNETIGLGVDGADSPGEGLRQHIEAVKDFFREMREEFPDLVIEVCSSGGFRLEPSFMEVGSMASFSDAHESLSIPIIAAQVQRLILPRQSQIWAVLHPHDTRERLAYSLAGGFLGRLCLSGDVEGLSDEQWAFVSEAVAFYGRIAPIIANGHSRFHGEVGRAWEHPEGAQGVVRVGDDGSEALVVAHTFAGAPASLDLPLPAGEWEVAGSFAATPPDATVAGSTLTLASLREFEGVVLHLARR